MIKNVDDIQKMGNANLDAMMSLVWRDNKRDASDRDRDR
jgi:hypothetical protein